MTRSHKAAAGVLAIAIAVTTAGLSRVPVFFVQSDDAMVRLSWRNDGVAVEACRERTPAEIEALPPHMRNPMACIGRIASYGLTVRLDGSLILSDTIHPSGLRGDRPLYVIRDLTVSPGPHDVRVGYTALLPAEHPVPEGIVSLAWEGVLSPKAGDIALITLDDETQDFVVRRAAVASTLLAWCRTCGRGPRPR